MINTLVYEKIILNGVTHLLRTDILYSLMTINTQKVNLNYLSLTKIEYRNSFEYLEDRMRIL